MDTLKRFVKGDEGQTMVEYGLIAALVSIAAIVALGAVGTSLDAIWQAISGNLAV